MSLRTIACSILLVFLACVSCKSRKPLFVLIPSSESGIHFNNTIVENDSINPSDMINVYNGGGVGIGDFNKDGLPDIYFTGNLVSNKLYLNKGNFKFEDITESAGVGGAGKWCKGVAVVDINNDGWPDIYVCASISRDPDKRRNLLYINQGNGPDGIPHFKEMAAAYGLDDTTHSTMAAFFDYDNDGDLDMYLVVNENIRTDNPNFFRPIHTDGSHRSTGRLYRNDWSDSLKHPVFTNVSRQAGILTEGYGHAATITDINQDGWADIYVSNDFLSDDILYVNNHDGTFTDRTKEYFRHTSATAMGQDVEDINNDGLGDLVELDMNPEDNYRKKTMMGGNNYLTYQNFDYFGYQYQYVRNTLQLNQGPRVGQNDSIGAPVFSEIGFYAGISETDWSWTPLVADFDNDGFRDIIVTNGYPKDVTDHDFTVFRAKANNLLPKADLLKQIPEVKLNKYAFKNNGDLQFSNVSRDWGMTDPAYSNGAAYADLDNDGDLDMVINNINDEAMVYRNNSRERSKEGNHYLHVQLTGDSLNRDGIGARIELHYDHGKQQVYENTPFRGYLSTIQNIAHFGLGNTGSVDTVLVKWPGRRMQYLFHVPADQLLKVNIRDAHQEYSLTQDPIARNTLFREITDSVNIHYRHTQKDFIDFNIQKLLPHKFSEYGPGLAVGDVDGNGLEDIVVGGAAHNATLLFLQQPDGRFVQRSLLPGDSAASKIADDLGLLLFDADGDGDLDLYIASGGYGNPVKTQAYQDRLYINDGKGNFTLDPTALPANLSSKFCVRAADFDHDGDLDLFVSGRVEPGKYPQPVSSYIFRNDSKNGHIQFTDVTATVAKDLIGIGLVCDGLWTDFDNDGWPDLVLAGEWMPVTFLKNEKGVFKNVTAASGISDHTGWWNSIVAGDFDNDGDMDYIVGNVGQNSFYKASPRYPVRVYGGDFDKNGIYDMIPSLYLPDRDGTLKEFPAESRDDLLRQMTSMRKKFPDYKSYAVATMDQVLTPDERKGALILQANDFQTCLLRNEGDGRFTRIALPVQAQLSVINGMVAEDFDGDGKLDVVLSGNDYGTEVSVGRYDALNGLYLRGDGKGNFTPQSILKSGLFLPGNQKALVKLRSAGGKCLLAAGQNRGPLQVIELKRSTHCISLQADEVSALITYRDGSVRKEETAYGSSFLSQSGRFINVDGPIVSVEITSVGGKTRKVMK
ncbi:MAG TPA: VCBS repeat-containing protein [Puia sp.]